MATAADVVNTASKFIGTCEKPANSNKTIFGQWYLADGEPWCAKFASYVLDQVGIKDYRHKYTPAGAERFRAQGRWHSTGQPGDLAYFDFPGDGVNRISHVGIVEQRQGEHYICIEGNTSQGTQGSQRDGGGVYRRKRHRALIVGFGRPPYEGAAPAKVAILRNGSKGREVLDWQRSLNRVAAAGLTEDGEFGPATHKATATFQRVHKLVADGEVGPKTLAAMAGELGKLQPVDTAKRPVLLKEGAQGSVVRQLQLALARQGHSLTGTGAFGPKTTAAVKAFQKKRGLKVDGIAGPATMRALGL